jgi:hypothetical protein
VPRTAYTATDACRRVIEGNVFATKNVTYSFYGNLVTASEIVQTKTDGIVISTETLPIPTSQLAELTGVVYAVMPTLVKKQGDTPNAAPGVRIGDGAGSVMGLLVIWMTAALAGAILLVPF